MQLTMISADASENWDEDFEFNGNEAASQSDTKPSPSSSRRSIRATPHTKDRRSSQNFCQTVGSQQSNSRPTARQHAHN